MKQLVAVYGTLKKGFGNHRLLEDQKFIGEFNSEPKYTMIGLGGFPGVLLNGTTSIKCEVFEVNNQNTLNNLDRLEGYPHFYDKTYINTPWGKAIIYFLPDTYNDSLYDKIDTGCWEKKSFIEY